MADEWGRDQIAKVINKRMPKPGIFANSITAGLQRPVAGAAAALDFWNYPGSSMSDRFHGGMDAYSDKLNEQVEDTHPLSALAQDTAGGLLLGGPSGSLWKQAAYDAGTGATQSAASGDDWGDIFGSAAINAGLGGALNLGGKGYGKARQAEEEYYKMLESAGIRHGR